MRYRKMAKTGVEISEIGFGGWGIGGAWWAGADDEASLRSLITAFELGVNFVDTAPNYGDGRSERLIGQAVSEWSGRIYVTTKVNPGNFVWPARPGTPLEEVFTKEWIIKSTENSLRNLGTEQIDLQLLHVWLDEWADRDEWKEAFLQLKQSGKVAAFGLSLNYPLEPDHGEKAIMTGLIDAVEVTYNIFEKAPEQELFPLAQRENVTVIAKSPLDEGALTGKVRPDTVFPEDSFRGFYFKGDRKQEVWERVQPLHFLLRDGDTMAQAALRFCLSHPAVTTVITGMRSLDHTRENVQASDRGPLAEEDLERLREHAWPHNFWE